MGKLKTGPSTAIIQESQGGQKTLTNFYTTSYSASHGKSEFQPRTDARSANTGYKSNFRVDLRDANSLEDNYIVQHGQRVNENYSTNSVKHQGPNNTPPGDKEKLPPTLLPHTSSCTRPNLATQAISRTLISPKNTLPRLPFKQKSYPEERCVRTFTDTSVCQYVNPKVGKSTCLKNIRCQATDTPKLALECFFSSNSLLCLPDGTQNGCSRNRFTKVSEQRGKFVRWPTLSGNESIVGARTSVKRDGDYRTETVRLRIVHHKREDAFTNVEQMPLPLTLRVKKQDPCEYLNAIKGGDYSSLTACHFEGAQRPHPSLHSLLLRASVGRREASGFSVNNAKYVEPADNDIRLLSEYGSTFTPTPLADPGLYRLPGITKHCSGFTKGTGRNRFGDGLLFTPAIMGNLNPLAARARKRLNPCYVDNTRSSVLRESWAA